MANFGFNFQLPDISDDDLQNRQAVLAIKNQLYSLQEQLRYTFGNLNFADNFGSTVSLGGKNNSSGVLEIKNERGNVMVLLNKKGITMSDGTDIFGAAGLRSVLQYHTGDWMRIGYQYSVQSEKVGKAALSLKVYVPENYTVTNAEVIFYHAVNRIEMNQYHSETDSFDKTVLYGFARNIRLYLDEKFNQYYRDSYWGSEVIDRYDNSGAKEIPNAFGSSGFTPDQPSDTNLKVQTAISGNVSEYLKSGMNHLLVQTGDDLLSYTGDLGGLDSQLEQHSGLGHAIINITGYTK